VINHIDSFPRYKSHYTRSVSTKEFLNPELSLSKMYDLYSANEPHPVSLSTYRHVFYTNFNLRFKTVKKDTCKTCDQLTVSAASAEGEKKTLLQEEHNMHLQSAEAAKKQMDEDLHRALLDTTVETLTYDLQKVLSLPRIPTNIVYYKRQLSMFNLGIHSGSDNKGYFYVWIENEGGRGAQDIGSALLKHIHDCVPSAVEHLILWSDSCGGQNRNIKICLMLQYVLQKHKTLKTITFRYRVSGHSFLPNDSEFGDVECALRRQERLYLPEDITRVMNDCRSRNRFVVTRMDRQDFVSTSSLEQCTVNRKVDSSRNIVSWLHAREIHLSKEKPDHLYLSTTFDPNDRVEVDVGKRLRGHHQSLFVKRLSQGSLEKLYPQPKPIAPAKLADLRSLMDFIPKNCHSFYESLASSNDVQDDVDMFGIAPDFVDDDDENYTNIADNSSDTRMFPAVAAHPPPQTSTSAGRKRTSRHAMGQPETSADSSVQLISRKRSTRSGQPESVAESASLSRSKRSRVIRGELHQMRDPQSVSSTARDEETSNAIVSQPARMSRRQAILVCYACRCLSFRFQYQF